MTRAEWVITIVGGILVQMCCVMLLYGCCRPCPCPREPSRAVQVRVPDDFEPAPTPPIKRIELPDGGNHDQVE